jgi:hypothetical protein
MLLRVWRAVIVSKANLQAGQKLHVAQPASSKLIPLQHRPVSQIRTRPNAHHGLFFLRVKGNAVVSAQNFYQVPIFANVLTLQSELHPVRLIPA